MGRHAINPETGLQMPTKKQQLFIDAYLISFSIAQAGKACGFVKDCWYSSGKRTFNLPHIKAIIELRKNDYLEGLGFSRERIIAELCKQAFADMGNFIEWTSVYDTNLNRYFHTVRVKDSSEIDTSVLKTVKINKSGQLEIDLYDKQNALTTLAKILGINAADKVELTGAGGGSIKIEDLRGKLIERISRLTLPNDTGTEVSTSPNTDV